MAARRGTKAGQQGEKLREKKKGPPYKDVRRLVDAIFEKNDPVATATYLLTGKPNPTVAKTWALLLEYRYGKPAQQLEGAGPSGGRFNFITTAPRPAREYENGETGEEG
jgi:hypothetical protein